MAIVKVQRSLATTAATPRMLVYDETREIYYESELTPEVDRLLAGRAKAYFEYTIDADNKVRLGREAPTQNW